jgi:hypothetical protein
MQKIDMASGLSNLLFVQVPLTIKNLKWGKRIFAESLEVVGYCW